ncbi:hypothetical protein STEG23_012508, partial [Scotinomys teguina]
LSYLTSSSLPLCLDLDSPPSLYSGLKAWFTMLGCDFDPLDFDLPCDRIKGMCCYGSRLSSDLQIKMELAPYLPDCFDTPHHDYNRLNLENEHFQSSDQCLAVDLCICFHQLLDKGSLVTIRVVTNLSTVDVHFSQSRQTDVSQTTSFFYGPMDKNTIIMPSLLLYNQCNP